MQNKQKILKGEKKADRLGPEDWKRDMAVNSLGFLFVL